MTLGELHRKVAEAVESEPAINEQEVAQYLADARERFDPNSVKWAIEDETEREEWEKLLILTVMSEYYKENQ